MKEALKLANLIEHFDSNDESLPLELLKEIAATLRALAQPEQEPWMYRIWNDKDAQWRLTDDCSWPAEPIYTTPPKRPWVGLTAQEAADCWTTSATQTWHNFEAALRSKNI